MTITEIPATPYARTGLLARKERCIMKTRIVLADDRHYRKYDFSIESRAMAIASIFDGGVCGMTPNKFNKIFASVFENIHGSLSNV